jgi:predicted ribosome quality control (RQC) complex YloA/Tae2 family protein
MDGLTFHKLLKLLDRKYKNAVLNRLSAEGNILYLSLYKGGEACVLSFSAAPPPAFAKVPIAVGESSGALKAVTGSVITAFEGRSYDRLGYVRLNRRKPSGKTDNFTLVLEPMGKHANAFLLNAEGMIQFNLTFKSIDPDRDIGVGKVYIPPKANKIYSLDNPSPHAGFSEYLGFYPPTAKIADAMAQNLGFEKTIDLLKEELSEGSRFYLDKAGRLFPFQDCDSSLEEIEFENFTPAARQSAGDEKFILDKLLGFYKKGLAHYKSTEKKLEEELTGALNWETVRQEAELIKANIYTIKGKGIYNLVSYGENGEEITAYSFNSDKTTQGYMEELFKKMGKLRRSIPHLKKRLEEVTQLGNAAREQIYFIEKAAPTELKEIFQLLNKDKMVSKVSKQEFHRFEHGNSVIYVGKNSASNYKLVFRFANQNDIWLHARNIPSAHVIIRTDGARAGEETILYAASLAAYFSKGSAEKSVEIDYTLRKYVKKPPNTPPGYVTYTNFKTLNAAPNSPF